MSAFTLENPVFRIYVLAAAFMIFKMLGQAFITVYQMLRVKGGFASPEDIRKTPLNPDPKPGQLEPNEAVERSRRMHRNDCENIPLFLAAGLIFVAAEPSPALAAWLMYGYVASRVAHFFAYLTAQIHDVRATFYTIGVLILVAMTGIAVNAALAYS